MNSRLTHISKEISYALRHHPEEYGLTLDSEGFVEIDNLLAAVNAKHPGRRPVTETDIEEIVATSEKKRHEIVGTRIRALYGHSFKEKIVHEPAEPPCVLYHGTARRFLPSIFRQGLLPMKRQYVHLSADVPTALEVGRRRDAKPALLIVDAKRASASGIGFYRGNDDVWLADPIPPEYLTLAEGED
jgi:putative RNA 2'-phosphotransferase